MDLQEAKEHILRVLPLGIDLYAACVQAHIPLADIEALENDQEFQREITYALKHEEMRLLTLYSETVDKAAYMKLDHKGLRDRLELINPGTYSKKAIEARSGHEEKPAIKPYNTLTSDELRDMSDEELEQYV